MPSQIISIHVGRGGSLVGVDTVARMCCEHNITPDGTMAYNASNNRLTNVFFGETSSGRTLPRSLFLDLEPKTLDGIATGAYRGLFHPQCLISGGNVGSGGNNFALGKELGKDIIERVRNSVRKLVNNCEALQGFIIYNASGGGTGAGLTSLLCENLAGMYKKKEVLNFSIDPDLSTTAQAFNQALGLHAMFDDVHLSIPLGKTAIKTFCQRQLLVKKPTATHMNRLIARIACATTASLRFESRVNQDLREFRTNLVPYSTTKFILSSYGPLISNQKAYVAQMDATNISNYLLENPNVVCNVRKGRVLGATLTYRGDLTRDECVRGANNAKARMNFINWAPTGFKMGQLTQPPVTVPGDDVAKGTRSGLLLSNNTAVSEMFSRCAERIDKGNLSSSSLKRYTGNGVELDDLREARYHLQNLLTDYREAAADADDEEEEEEEEEEDYPRSRM